jgi:hypothetical protein
MIQSRMTTSLFGWDSAATGWSMAKSGRSYSTKTRATSHGHWIPCDFHMSNQ